MVSDEKKALLALIAAGESKTVEFKSTLRFDLKNGSVASFIEHAVVKTLAAFLNTEGGTLLIGVDDGKNVLGLQSDFATFKGVDKIDEFNKHFDNLFSKIGNRFHRYARNSFPVIDGKTICQVTIKCRAESPVYLKDEKGVERFYIRRNASTVDLPLSEATAYVREHWQEKARPKRKNVKKKVDMFASRSVFKSEMQRLLSDTNSSYYTELRKHWNSYSLIEDSPLLKSLCVDQLAKAIDFGLLPILSDWACSHLYNDRDAKYVYNQPHVYLHNTEDEGYNLPVYYHIRFIGILYATAIRNKVDIDVLSRRFKSMISIYSSMITAMAHAMDYQAHEREPENPTNYHWLIGEILSTVSNWIDQFNEKFNFSTRRSYLGYIPHNIRDCFCELYKGLDEGRFSLIFVVRKFYYTVLTHYFSPLSNELILKEIEDQILSNIPPLLIEPILKFSLDEAFAIGLDEFYGDRGHFNNKGERRIVQRLKAHLAMAK